jgi:hypothetical protein
LIRFTEAELVAMLRPIAERGWPVVVHPDIVKDHNCWKRLGDRLCLENMDKRKATGRTAAELEALFARLPDATLCFDIGHARQVDPTMCEANSILRRFSSRLQQVHLSVVNSFSQHLPLNFEGLLAFRRVAHLIPRGTPIILETPVGRSDITAELDKAGSLLERHEICSG